MLAPEHVPDPGPSGPPRRDLWRRSGRAQDFATLIPALRWLAPGRESGHRAHMPGRCKRPRRVNDQVRLGTRGRAGGRRAVALSGLSGGRSPSARGRPHPALASAAALAREPGPPDLDRVTAARAGRLPASGARDQIMSKIGALTGPFHERMVRTGVHFFGGTLWPTTAYISRLSTRSAYR